MPPRTRLTLPTLLLLLLAWSPPRAEPTPVDHYFSSSDGLRLHYIEAGAGARTLLFVPGWLMPAAIFERQVAVLAREYRVIAFDPRSQGQSQVSDGSHRPEIRLRDLHELLAAAGVGEFVLAGWSLGVLESLDFIERYRPAGLKGLILIDNSIGEGRPPAGRSTRGGQAPKGETRAARLKRFAASLFKRPPPKRLLQTVEDSALRVPPAAASELLNQPYPRTYWRDIVLRQEIPILYAITPRLREQGEALERKKAGLATVLVFAEAGHALFVDAAERFNAAVAALAQRAFSVAPPVGSADPRP